MQRVLITGAAGSVGRETAAALVTKGYRVKAFDLPTASFGGLAELANVEVEDGDITDQRAVCSAVEDADIVIHMASLLPPASERSRENTFAVNVVGTANLVEAVRECGRGIRTIFASTVEVDPFVKTRNCVIIS